MSLYSARKKVRPRTADIEKRAWHIALGAAEGVWQKTHDFDAWVEKANATYAAALRELGESNQERGTGRWD